MSSLDEEVERCRRELCHCPSWSIDRLRLVSNLSDALLKRYQQLGGIEYLEESIAYYRHGVNAINLCPIWNPHRSTFLNNLANSVFTLFEQSGRMEDLEEAITCHRGALALFPQGHPNRPPSLNNLGGALSTRFEQLGGMEDLEGAITYHREALALCPQGHPSRSFSLNNLGIAMSTRFKQSERMGDLEEAITRHREALALFSHGHPLRSSSLSNLASSVFTRFQLLGKMEDLEDAITCHRKALVLHSHGHPSHSSSLDGLASSMFTRFEQLGRMEDLEEAITCHREALALRPHGHPDRSSSLNNLANAVFTCFEQLRRIDNLEEAIACHHEALSLFPHGHANRSSYLFNLAHFIWACFRQSGVKGDLLDASKYISEAKSLLPIDHPSQATTGSGLASILLNLCDTFPEPNESPQMTSKAFDLFEQAANHSFASAKARFQAAVQWAREAHRRKHQSTVQAYAKSLSLLNRCLVLAPTVESQQIFLAATKTVPKALALDAASSAIDAGELGTAVEFLEQGRAILWSKLRGYRHPLDELRVADRKLADQFEALSGQLECLAMSSESQSTTFPGSNAAKIISVTFEVKMQQHRILSEKWDGIVAKIRQIDGFADFLQAVPFVNLQKAASEGPVIIVNIGSYRSDAIILLDVGDPVLVPLSGTLPMVLDRLSSQFTKARASDGKDSARQILPILRTLWDNIAFPVRAQLVALGVQDKSRIWWCPTSALCALPLHAAGAYSPKVPKPDNLPDCYISSYTPTLSALIKARSGILSRSIAPNLLVIAQPDETLPEVEEEINCIRRLKNNVNVLQGPEANHDTVLASLKNHSWAHFACHGHLNTQPFHSSFQMHNHSCLALVDLIGPRLVDAELVFLSACHTAAGDMVGTPDEVIHLASALQFCGFRSVVGTLWAMEDVDGRDATEDFYQHMFRSPGDIPDFRDSAEALNLATRKMRKRGLGLDRWVKFVHIGA